MGFLKGLRVLDKVVVFGNDVHQAFSPFESAQQQ